MVELLAPQACKTELRLWLVKVFHFPSTPRKHFQRGTQGPALQNYQPRGVNPFREVKD